MVSRVAVALSLSLLAFLATTGVSWASEHQPDLEEVAIGTFLVALGFMALLLIIYLIKHALGLDRALPPETDSDHGAHH